MRLGIILLLLALLLAQISSMAGGALGGVVVTGAGFGTAQASNGAFYCPDAAFSVRAIFLPGDSGVLEYTWADPSDCMTRGVQFLGGDVALGTLFYNLQDVPPIEWKFTCSGNEAVGLNCGTVRLGPYGGIGASMWLWHADDFSTFSGTFVAV